MSKKDVTKHGLLTIKGARKAGKYLSSDEILFIVQKFLREYSTFPVTVPLVIDFSKKRDREFRWFLFQIYIICLIIFGIVNLFLLPALGSFSFSKFLLSTFLMSLILFLGGMLVAWPRLVLRGLGPARGRFDAESLGISVMAGLASNKRDLIVTIVHELDHYLWYLEHNGLDNSPPYGERLHEVRADNRSYGFVSQLVLET